MAAPLKTHPRTYDDAKLLSMVAPLQVRVEKIKGSSRMPIPLPPSEDGKPGGTDWTAEDVRALESWLVTQWSGGGLYEVTITDSSQVPLIMKWQPWWDDKEYPHLVPPPLRDAAVQQQTQPQQPMQGRFMSAFPQGLPPGGYMQPQGYQQGYPQQGGYYQQPQLGPSPVPGTPPWDAWKAEAEKRERDNELRMLREKSETREREAIASKHVAEIERERQANEQRFQGQATQLSELRNMLTQLAQTMQNNPKQSSELEAMREAHRQTEARLERERAEREAERREREMRDMVRTLNETTQRQIDVVTRQFEERSRAMELAAQNNNKPDQLLAMWQQNNREQADAMKELARNQTLQMQSFQNYMMNPRDIMTMAKESSQSADSAADRVTRFMSTVIDTQQKVTENLLNMQPGGSGVVDLVDRSIDRAGSLAEKYLGGKQLEAQLSQASQVQIAEAQARAYAQAAQAQADASRPVQAQPPAGFAGPVIDVPVNGATNGVKPGVDITAKPEPKLDETRRLGRTDAEWFGVLLPNVQELRGGAQKFLDSLKKTPPRVDRKGNPIGTSPEQASEYIIQAIQAVVAKQVPIAAMMDLLFQDRFADFIDVMLPGVTQPYRDDVTQIIIRAARIAKGLPPDDEPAVDAEAKAKADAEADDEPDDDDDDSENDADDDSDDSAEDAETDKAQDGKAQRRPVIVPRPRVRA